MNEYSDQVTWYEVQHETPYGWLTLSDHDTHERAEISRHATQAVRPEGVFRTVPVRGQE